MPLEYPCLLRPTAIEKLPVSTGFITVPKVELELRRWAGHPITHTFGNKPLLDFGGRPLFAELCGSELFRLSGWEARWVETYGASAKKPHLFTAWQDAPLGQQSTQPLPDDGPTALLAKIAALNNGSYAGCWDVLGWRNGAVLFAELKRRKQDRLRPTQIAWLEASLRAGLQPDNFLLLEWDFSTCV